MLPDFRVKGTEQVNTSREETTVPERGKGALESDDHVSVGERVSHQGKLWPGAREPGEFIHPVLLCWDWNGAGDLTSGTETRETSFHAESSRVCWSLAQGNSLQEVQEEASA